MTWSVFEAGYRLVAYLLNTLFPGSLEMPKRNYDVPMYFFFFFNSCFESISQMLSSESNVLQDRAVFLAQF